jgi:hypothetical protein
MGLPIPNFISRRRFDMNKLARRILAGTLSATMVLGSAGAVFADDQQDSQSTTEASDGSTLTTSSNSVTSGTINVEVDNSTAPDYYNVVLPLSSYVQKAFEFTADPDGILAKFDSATYTSKDGLYFNTETPAQLKAKEKLYSKSYEAVKEADLTAKFKALATVGGDASDEITTVDEGLYVWTPEIKDGTPTGLGVETPITDQNYSDYLKVTIDAGEITKVTLRETSALVGDNIFDGNIYAYTYVAAAEVGKTVNAEGTYTEATEGGDPAEFTFTSGKELYTLETTTDEDAGTTTTSYEEAVLDDDFEYVKPVEGTSSTSEKITVENKSTKAATVTASVKLENIDGLTFGTDSALSTGDIYLALQSSKSSTATALATPENADGTASAEITVNLSKAKNSTVTYQQVGSNATGSHDYYQYELQGVTYDSVDITLTGATKTSDAWKTYTDAVTSDKAPTFSVVYSLAQVESTADPITIETASKKAASGSAVSFVFSGVQEGTTVESVTTSAGSAVGTARYTFDDKTGTLKFDSTFTKNNYSSFPQSYTVKFSTGDEVVIKITKG